jgi:hypothetical protein
MLYNDIEAILRFSCTTLPVLKTYLFITVFLWGRDQKDTNFTWAILMKLKCNKQRKVGEEEDGCCCLLYSFVIENELVVRWLISQLDTCNKEESLK